MLDTWRRSPARLREDANAEESLAHVGYAGRVLVELAANAADAAIEAGVPGRLLITVVGDEVRVANNGAPLTAAGVASLASLRASAKGSTRSSSAGVGHFGVGFTAALAASERPSVVSSTGGVRFSAVDTAAAIDAAGSAELAAEVRARDGHVPVLRLPWPTADRPPPGFDTEVRLPLRAGVTAADLLAEVGDYLLLALPGLDSIELPGRTLTRVSVDSDAVVLAENDSSTSWRLATRSGELSDTLLAGLPTEQRRRRQWQLAWAYPVGRALGPDVLYAPTPTDEALDLPARLIGSFPVDDTRRHLAAGPVADLLVTEAIAGYLELMADTAPERRLQLLPAPDFGRSEVDNRLRQGIWAGIRRTPLLVSAAGEAIRPDQAVMLPGASSELIALAAEALPGLLPTPRDAVERDGLRALGVRAIGYPELSAALGSLQREPSFWGRLYAELDVAGSDDLADLPVPLAGGRTVISARGCLLLGADAGWLDAISATVPRLKVVHPAAVSSPIARRLLLRIGAAEADPSVLLADAAVLQVAAELHEDLESDEVSVDEVEAFGAAVLELIAAGATAPDELRATLLLTSASGEAWPAAELLLPDAPLAAVLAPDADLEELSPWWTDRHPDEVLRRAGVLAGFRVVRDAEPTGPDHDLPDEDEYWEQVIGDGAPPADFSALADLDLVADDRWPAALDLIRSERETLETLRSTAGRPSYTAWWLSRFALIGGEAPQWWRLPGATGLAGLYDPVPLSLDPGFAAAVGVRSSLEQVLGDDPVDLLHRLADPRRRLPAVRVPTVTAALVAAFAGRGAPTLPDGVRTLSGQVADADDATVLDEPWFAQLLDPALTVPGGADPAVVARFFDLELASERYPVDPPASGGALGDAAADDIRRVAAELGIDVEGWLSDCRTAAELSVDWDGTPRRVRWWVAGSSNWVDGSPEGWGRLLAHRAGDWALRHTATALCAGRRVEVVEDGLTNVGVAVPRSALEES